MATEDILIGYAKVWLAPVGEAFPDETSIDYGDAWGGNWEYIGDTLEPLVVAVERNVVAVEIQQATTPVKESITSMVPSLQTTVAVHSMDLLNKVLGGTLTTTAAGAGQKAWQRLQFGGEADIDYFAVGFEALYKTSGNVQEPVRYLFWKGSLTLNGNINFDKGAPTGIPINITILTDTAKALGEQLGEIHYITAEPTS